MWIIQCFTFFSIHPFSMSLCIVHSFVRHSIRACFHLLIHLRIPSFLKPHVHSHIFLIQSGINQLMHLPIHAFIRASFFSRIHFYIHQLLNLLVHYAYYLFIRAFTHSSNHANTNHSCILPVMNSSMHFFICESICAFPHSLLHWWIVWHVYLSMYSAHLHYLIRAFPRLGESIDALIYVCLLLFVILLLK
jgi:hypothetical protein